MKAKAWQEIRAMTKSELELKLREAEEKLFRLKFKHSSTKLRNPLEIRTLKKMVAKIRTLMNEQKEQTSK
jgi:large subunit ribosomal protein L29